MIKLGISQKDHMQAAIIGDVYGSIFEDIPNLPKRSTHQPTDDSFLTAACFEWMHFDVLKLINPKQSHLTIEQKQILASLAIDRLIEWFDNFPYINAFSPGFSKWVKTQKQQKNITPTHQGNTNGCLMRQSPIIHLSYINNLQDSLIFDLSHCFSSLTHSHPEAQEATRLHTQMLLDAHHHPLKMYNQLLTHQYGEVFSLTHWQQYKHFIYDAKTSLSIVISLLAHAHDFDHFLHLVSFIGKDADTYLAIGAPLASKLWTLKSDRIQWCSDILTQTPSLYNVFIKME